MRSFSCPFLAPLHSLPRPRVYSETPRENERAREGGGARSAGYCLIYTNAPGTYLTLTKAPARSAGLLWLSN